MTKPKDREENAKADAWKVPMKQPGVKPSDYIDTGSKPGANARSK